MFRERYFTSQDGLRLYYREYGESLSSHTPVLCLGGLSRNSADFDSLALRLSPRRRVICPDYRGRGRSEYDPNWRNYTGPTYINDIRHLMAAAGLHRMIVVGTSMGGLLASGLGVAAPAAIAGVIMNDVGPDIAPEGTKRILDYLSQDRPQPNWEAAVTDAQARMPDLSYETGHEWRRFVEATYREGEDGQLHFDWDINIVRPLLGGGSNDFDLWRLFRSLRRMPLLVIRGERSDVMTADTLGRMTLAHPKMKLVTLPGVGHAPSLNEPEARDAIIAFIASL
ncbi:MAG: alpha/beta hydrolase [Alphaproteobacteria bacterium]|nr:alpha/beta hydrolase [Alphaproteobacteria bacterium]